MSRRLLSALVLLVATTGPLFALEASLPRHPAPSPDGSQIAFSWQGDLWLVAATGGDARRITAHPAAERSPVWSRDGRALAFSSDRHGSFDVFVMTLDGVEPPRRLTHASVTDIPYDFTPDGSAVVFHSRRGEGVRWYPQLFTVPVAGGTPAILQDAFGAFGTYSPDGRSLVFVRGVTKWYRRGYTGPANRDLWIRTEGSYRQLTTFDGDDDVPSWLDDRSVLFLSSRAGRKNLFRLDTSSGQVDQLTSFDGTAVRWPRASADGRVVAFEYEDAIWTMASNGGEPVRLHIHVPADQVINPVQRRTETMGAEGLTIHPDGDLAAFVVHGDIFVTEITSKEDQEIAPPATVRVTRTPEREQDPTWSPDGKRLLFVSARDGARSLFSAQPTDGDTSWTDCFEFETTEIASTPSGITDPVWSPDGERIAFTRGKGDIVVVAADGGDETVILEHWDTPDYRWSPDGKWIAYSVEDMNANAEVWIVPATGGTPYNVSRHPDFDRTPRWSPDGKRLVWLTNRHADTTDVWGVWLTRADDERTPAEWLKEFKSGADDEADESDETGDEESGDDADELPTVTIDFERLWERATAITDMLGNEDQPLVSPDGKAVVFTAERGGERDIYTVRWDGEDVERLTTGDTNPSYITFDAKGATLFFLDDKGTIQRVGLDGKPGDPVPFTARYEVDIRDERGVVIDEAWSALDSWFYDPDFHGVDWPAQLDTYRPWALEASSEGDFAAIVNLMIGELNASHMGYYPAHDAGGETTGFIGAFFDPTAGGPGLLVREVLPDSPAARHDVNLVAGERILAVNGRTIESTTNIYDLFVDAVDLRVPLRVAGTDGVQRTVTVMPITARAQSGLRYREWVRQRRRLTEEYSGGRLGYIHIEGMDMPSFEEFERGLFAAADGKEGLVIDVRSNGGGWTTDHLLGVLMVQRHAYTVPRDADPDQRAYPTAERLPASAWTRPAVTLCNEDSYSNAEIFTHAFKTLGRGKVVGMPTFGAVISTGGTTLINGAHVRLPLRGWYVAESGLNMELNGAVPDVVVEQPPAEDRSATEDTQLRRAVEVLLGELATDPRRDAW